MNTRGLEFEQTKKLTNLGYAHAVDRGMEPIEAELYKHFVDLNDLA